MAYTRSRDLRLFPMITPSQRRRHVLDLDDFTAEELENIFAMTDAMKEVLERDIKKVPTLRGKTIITAFYEPSTRTRVSFEQAGKVLSADVINLNVPTSSVVKGESLLDTALTLQALGADIIVIRHHASGAPNFLAQRLSASVINAGDGSHAHPTQALLDLYTIRVKLGRVQGTRIAIVGDILHSRVARSNLWGLHTLGAQVVVCSPPTLLPTVLHEPTGGLGLPPVEIEYDIEKAISGADVVMVLRLQQERQEAGLLPSLREYSHLYQLNRQRLARAKPHTLVLHPGPMNESIEISSDVAHGAHSVIEEQVTNGVAIRMALLYLLATSERERRA